MLILYAVLMIILLFGLTIFVHELGHFLTARWLGLVIDVFSIGFGPALWKKEVRGITYKIGWLPFGGYVALPQMDPSNNLPADPAAPAEGAEPPRVLPPIAPWKKIIVALAGVTGNMVLAFLLAAGVYWGGQSYVPANDNIVGYVVTNCPAYALGLRIGDQIVRVNDTPVAHWENVMLEAALDDAARVEVLAATGGTYAVTLPTERILGTRLIMGVAPYSYCYVLSVEPNTSAQEAGVLPGDRIEELAGIRLYSREHLIEVVMAHRDQTLPVKVLRQGQIVDLTVTPRYNKELDRVMIGIQFNPLDVKPPLAQLHSHATIIFRLLRALVTPREAKHAAGSLGGPVAIIRMYWYAVQSSFLLALSFTCLLNVNLAIINLLPLPVLDGGHIVFSVLEIIFRRPLPRRVVEILSQAFAVLLIALFLLLTVQDIRRWVFPLFTSADDAAAATNTTEIAVTAVTNNLASTNAPAAPR